MGMEVEIPRTFHVVDFLRKSILQSYQDKFSQEINKIPIGILGGIGPLAGIDMCQKIIRLTPANTDQGHFRSTLYTQPDIPDRTTALQALWQHGDTEMVEEVVGKTVEGILALRHCSPIILACNTLHAFMYDIKHKDIIIKGIKSTLKSIGVDLPVLNMVYITAEFIHLHFPEITTIGLLATEGTIKAQIYKIEMGKFNIKVVVPDSAHQAMVTAAIYGPQGVKTLQNCHKIFPQAQRYLQTAWHNLYKHDAKMAVMGCTEIPLALGQLPGPWIDPAWITAAWAIAFKLGQVVST